MNENVSMRVIEVSKYFIKSKDTVRDLAKVFGVSKSTIHKDLTDRIYEINLDMYRQCKEILDYHKSIRHIRGGNATKLKYKKYTQH